jgi:hypothetical protein
MIEDLERIEDHLGLGAMSTRMKVIEVTRKGITWT